MQRLSVAIAGCGIAGLAAALLLHRQGLAVTLYERFAEARPVGSGLMLQPSGMAVLAQLGLAVQAVQRGARVAGLLGRNREGEAVLEASYADLPQPGVFGLGIHRSALFDLLHEAVLAAGVPIQTGFAVSACEAQDERVVLVSAQGQRSVAHDLVVDASGLGSQLVPQKAAMLPFGALWATVDWPAQHGFRADLLEQRYERASRMVGLLPVSAGRAAFFWSLRGQDYCRWQDGGMARWWGEVEDLWPQCAVLRDQLREPSHLVFARYHHRTSPPSADSRIVHLGDAWHAASPQLGQGANMALLDAYALCSALSCVLQAGGGCERIGTAYRALRRRHVQIYQALTWAFTPPFQSDAAWPAAVRDLLLAPASRIGPGPALKAMLVAGLAANPLGRLGLPWPDYPALGAAASSTASRASSLDQS